MNNKIIINFINNNKKIIIQSLNTNKYTYHNIYYDNSLINYKIIYNKYYNIYYNNYKIFISFPGSKNLNDFFTNLYITPYKFNNIYYHNGYINRYLELENNLLTDLSKIITLKHKNIIYTGHSLGGAISLIAHIKNYNKNNLLSYCFSFGSPKVYNLNNSIYIKNYINIINKNDFFCYYPPFYNLNNNIYYLNNNNIYHILDLYNNHHIDTYYNNIIKL